MSTYHHIKVDHVEGQAFNWPAVARRGRREYNVRSFWAFAKRSLQGACFLAKLQQVGERLATQSNRREPNGPRIAGGRTTVPMPPAIASRRCRAPKSVAGSSGHAAC